MMHIRSWLAFVAIAGASMPVWSQGCISSRGAGSSPGTCSMSLDGPTGQPWLVEVGYRWLHSDRMFSGDVEQTQREVEGSQEINDSHFIDLTVGYSLNSRWSLDLTVPLAVNDRSQVVRALNFQRTILGRFHTHSSGLGDLRAAGHLWIWDPTNHASGNLQLGLGVSLPTGDRDVQDTFLVPARRGPIPQVHAVDPSIQLSSGGWGVVMELSGFQRLAPRLTAYLNGNYTATPQEKYTPTASLLGDYSIADAYLGQTGLQFRIWDRWDVNLSLGGRIEGVPVHDLVGGSHGFRRPGYAVSIEPGVSMMVKSWTASLTAPVAVYRNRQQSVSERDAGVPPVAAGFADWVLVFNVSRRF